MLKEVESDLIEKGGSGSCSPCFWDVSCFSADFAVLAAAKTNKTACCWHEHIESGGVGVLGKIWLFLLLLDRKCLHSMSLKNLMQSQLFFPINFLTFFSGSPPSPFLFLVSGKCSFSWCPASANVQLSARKLQLKSMWVLDFQITEGCFYLLWGNTCFRTLSTNYSNICQKLYLYFLFVVANQAAELWHHVSARPLQMRSKCCLGLCCQIWPSQGNSRTFALENCHCGDGTWVFMGAWTCVQLHSTPASARRIWMQISRESQHRDFAGALAGQMIIES